MKRNFGLASTIVVLCLFLTACGDIAEIKKWDKVVAVSIGEAEKIAQTAFDNKVFDEARLKQIFTITHKATLAQIQFNAVLTAFEIANPDKKKISVASAQELLKLLDPISSALDPNQIATIFGVDNPDSRQKLIAKFNVARGAISSLQIVVAAAAGGNA